MPLYEYQCASCKRRIEKIQSFSAEPLRVCEFCGGALEKLISAPAIQFKGSGWYVTDYAKSGSSSASRGESKSDAAEGKPEAKAEPSSQARSDSKSDSHSDRKSDSHADSHSDGKAEAKPARVAPAESKPSS